MNRNLIDFRSIQYPWSRVLIYIPLPVWQKKWRSRTGRTGRWSRRLQRWWQSAPVFPTWLLGPRCLSISPSYSTLSATCWIHEHWCTSVWRNKKGLCKALLNPQISSSGPEEFTMKLNDIVKTPTSSHKWKRNEPPQVWLPSAAQLVLTWYSSVFPVSSHIKALSVSL